MPKSGTRRKTISRSSNAVSRSSEAGSKAPSSLKPAGRADSKQARLIAMLRASSGATIPAMMKLAGWQKHSVRGFLTGVVRTKLGLNLVSEERDGGRVYRIRDRKRPPAINKTAKTV